MLRPSICDFLQDHIQTVGPRVEGQGLTMRLHMNMTSAKLSGCGVWRREQSTRCCTYLRERSLDRRHPRLRPPPRHQAEPTKTATAKKQTRGAPRRTANWPTGSSLGWEGCEAGCCCCCCAREAASVEVSTAPTLLVLPARDGRTPCHSRHTHTQARTQTHAPSPFHEQRIDESESVDERRVQGWRCALARYMRLRLRLRAP